MILHMKNCPFCETYPELVEYADGWAVSCTRYLDIFSDPPCSGVLYFDDNFVAYSTPNEAVEVWNKLEAE